MFGFEAGGEEALEVGEEGGGDVNIEDATGTLVVKVGVLAQVGAVAGRLAVDIDLADEAAGDEGFETVIDGREGNGGHRGASAGVNLVGGGVVALIEQDGKDVLALARGTLAGFGQGVTEGAFGGGGEFHGRKSGRGTVSHALD